MKPLSWLPSFPSPQRLQRIGAALVRLLGIEIVALILGLGLIYKAYDGHWRGVRYRAQTLEFNLLAHTLPPTLSLTLRRGDQAALQAILDSNDGQFGLVLTDPQGKRILALSRPLQWGEDRWRRFLAQKDLAQHPFDFLWDPPSLHPQGLFPHADSPERLPQPYPKTGKIIGRVYYLRNPPPAFRQDLRDWIRTPHRASSRFELYSLILFSSLWGGAAVWTSVEYLRTKRQLWRREQRKLNRALGQSQRLHLRLQEEAESLRGDLGERTRQNSYLIHRLEGARAELQQTQSQQASQIQGLQQAIADYENKLAELEGTQEDDSHLQELQTRLLQAQERQRRTEERARALGQQIQTLRQQRDESQEKVRQLSQQLQSLPVQELETMVEQARQESAVQREYANYALDENQRLQGEIQELLTTNEALHQDNQLLKGQNYALREQVAGYQRRWETDDSLGEENDDLDSTDAASLPASRLTNISSRAAINALMRLGFKQDRQNGSHVILKKTEQYEISVPVPVKTELKPPTLRQIIRQAQVSGQAFLDHL
ncbi:MAG: type II toxin-antitoxin system HicA family toxin [Cyanobacteriota bacterium]|nr:type II toxin-antitoxin system HicA family toxin [Cyanobacteriota bacterium]